MKAAFHTLGCKVNQYETEAMKEQFLNRGFEIAGEEEWADVYVINTCTVTNMADRKSRQYIRRMKRLNPDALVAVTGCYPQVKPEELEAMEEVDIVTGNGEKGIIIDLVLESLKNKNNGTCLDKLVRVLPYDEMTEYKDKGIITSMENRTRAYIKIQEGCDRFCAYCLIPFARGHVRSRDAGEIVEEAKALIAQGFREIVLTGINTALYGEERGSDIEEIISLINGLQGEFRIRLSSLEPTVVNAEFVKKLAKYEKLCPHLHLSIQSGSDAVIERMNRHYTREEYLEIVRVLRESDPGYGITTDIIVGFPGEEEVDFCDSVRMVREAGYAKVHVFKYSRRKGTAADKMKNQVPDPVKNERSERLIAEAEQVAGEFLESLAGSVRTVLLEDFVPGGEEEGLLEGYADNYVKVYAPGGANDLNCLIKVKLLERYKDGMKGEIIHG